MQQMSGYAEIPQNHLPWRLEENILGLEVAAYDLPIVDVLYREANLREPSQYELLGEGGLVLPCLSDTLDEVSALSIRHDDIEVSISTLERCQRFDDEFTVNCLEYVRLPNWFVIYSCVRPTI